MKQWPCHSSFFFLLQTNNPPATLTLLKRKPLELTLQHCYSPLPSLKSQHTIIFVSASVFCCKMCVLSDNGRTPYSETANNTNIIYDSNKSQNGYLLRDAKVPLNETDACFVKGCTCMFLLGCKVLPTMSTLHIHRHLLETHL